MNSQSRRPALRRTRGNVLLMVLMVTGVLGIVAVAYIKLIVSQNSYTVRSQVWNNCPTCDGTEILAFGKLYAGWLKILLRLA